MRDDPTDAVNDDLQDALNEGDDETEDWVDQYPSETIRAVDPNEVTAGLDVTLYDFDDANMPPMLELDQHFPPEDDQDGDAVYLHGGHAVLQLLAAVSDLYSERFAEVPWDDE